MKRLKSRAGRRDLPLSPDLARRLWAARPPDGRGPVFRSEAGTRFIDRNVRRVLSSAATRAGLPWVHPHTFRHTCASLLFKGGIDVRQVADWLGHTDPAFTLRTYISVMGDRLGDPAFLDAAVALPGGTRGATPHPQTAATRALASGDESAL
jgi:integrase